MVQTAYNCEYTVRTYALTQILAFASHFVCPQSLGKTTFDIKFKIDWQILPHPKFAKEKELAEKKDFVFSSCFAPKRGSRLGAQATESRQSRDEIRALRLQCGCGVDSASLPDRSIYFFRLRVEADETE